MNKKKQIANLSSVLLVLDVILMVGARMLLKFQEEYTAQYRLAMIYTYAYYALFVVAAAWLVFNWKLLKEALRKMIIALKRKPSTIPFLMLLVSFLYYSLNLTKVSNTTALIQGTGMGLSQFCIMLVNMLCMLCMLNAFPRRKKPNIPMVVLVFAMLGVLYFCSYHYLCCVAEAVSRANSPIDPYKNIYVAQAYNMLVDYQVMIIVTAVLTATLPIYSKLIRKIKTSIEVEDNGAMGQIEIEE